MTEENNRIRVVVILVVMVCIAISGCSEIAVNDPSSTTETANPTDTEIHTTPSPTNTPTSTATATQTPTFTTKEKYNAFRNGYVESVEESGVQVRNTSLDVQNDTIYLAYQMRNMNNDKYVGNERENLSFGYVAGVRYYLDENQSGVDETWVPKQVNVTAVTPEGELYERAYITFERAKKMIDGDISERQYLLEYYRTIEPGPANPDYEG